MENNFKYSNSNKRYHTLDYYYKNKFKEKIFKVSLNANFSCPNIDGTVGYGGCIYCSKSGSGEFAGNKEDEIVKQFNEVKNVMLKKWPKAKYIGYFQARTNTHAPVQTLKKLHNKILKQEGIVGLNIATRPDAISDEVMDYLEELNKQTDLTIELGLQSIHEKTLKYINKMSKKELEESLIYILNISPDWIYDKFVRALLSISSLKTHSRFAPWSHWTSMSNRSSTFTTTVWVIYRVHGRTPNCWAHTHMTCYTSFTN